MNHYKIFRLVIITALTQLFILSTHVYSQYPSDSAQISLMTASPGPELYELYGHSFIRVLDNHKDIDMIYNYGVFDFDTPNFALKFTNGRLQYQLAKASFKRFMLSYEETGQTVFEQKLNLTNHEKWQLITNLEANYRPENRYYRYDFFHDNCATRIRDVIAKSVDGKVVYDSTYIKKTESFRDLIIAYQKVAPWLDFGTHILIGSNADSIAGVSDYMFLPEHMMKIYDRTNVITGDKVRPLVQPSVVYLQGAFTPKVPSPITSPVLMLSLLFVAATIFTIWEYKNQKRYRVIDYILLISTGLVGLMIVFVWTGSAHEVLSRNYNIIWANPLNLVFASLLFKYSQSRWYTKASLIYALILFLFIGASFFISQHIPSPAYPIIGILVIRLTKMGLTADKTY